MKPDGEPDNQPDDEEHRSRRREVQAAYRRRKSANEKTSGSQPAKEEAKPLTRSGFATVNKFVMTCKVSLHCKVTGTELRDGIPYCKYCLLPRTGDRKRDNHIEQLTSDDAQASEGTESG